MIGNASPYRKTQITARRSNNSGIAPGDRNLIKSNFWFWRLDLKVRVKPIFSTKVKTSSFYRLFQDIFRCWFACWGTLQLYTPFVGSHASVPDRRAMFCQPDAMSGFLVVLTYWALSLNYAATIGSKRFHYICSIVWFLRKLGGDTTHFHFFHHLRSNAGYTVNKNNDSNQLAK